MRLSDLAMDTLIEESRYEFDSVLDIGSGSGEHADYFESSGSVVTRFDFGKSRAFTDLNKKVILGNFLEYDFAKKYDLIWASHVLEHTIHPHEFLLKIKNTCSENGLIAITVPPAKPEFVGGHVSLWTPALLVYHLVLAGIDCSEAEVMVYGYNISIIVKNKPNNINIKDLYWDYYDLDRIKEYFPPNLIPSQDGSVYGQVFNDAINLFK
jgi:SAM-dependent methyltransferase